MLGVDSNLRVLRVLAAHGGFLGSGEVVRRSRLSRESVRLALIDLGTSGIVIAAGSSNTKLHRFNADHVLAPTLEALFKAESDRYAAIWDSVKRCAAGKPVLSLFVYGSAARGEDRPDSDLDIGVVTEEEHLADVPDAVREGLRECADRFNVVPSVVSLAPSDLERLERERDPWWESVKADMIVVFGRNPVDLIGKQGCKSLP